MIIKFRDEHPCQLPIHLLERIILMSTDENDIVLDPFNGTGTTAIAAKRLGRQYIGFELDEEYVKITENKLLYENPNSKMGDCWVSFYLDEVVTLRNNDWEYLKDFYHIPRNVEEVDNQQIGLKNKINVQTPLKSAAILSKNYNQSVLFEAV
ncbi:MAG: site-specific DNA-methyltransferase [Prevotellaceae bacterium]|jgi:site-specific DNA-methyltransferase (adenine-specific)|nr:site-specific DNA-methyltransferase [Prevotellaceae bacterium]